VLAKLPGDGSGTGFYTLGAVTFGYLPTSLTDAASSLTDAASSLTDAATSLTDAASSLTDAATFLTSSIAPLIEGPGSGLVWIKGRSGATDHALYDTARGATFDIASNLPAAQTTQATGLTDFVTTGFSIGSLAKINTNAATYVSWTFRKQPRFFDMVTYTGNGTNRTITHNLGSVPGCIMIKRLNASDGWSVYHRSLLNTQYLVLNSTASAATAATFWNSTTATSTNFSLGTSGSTNFSGGTYVAYIFAHNAGGFGATGADNVISCGSYTGNGGRSGPTVTLGYEPQWLLIKPSSSTGDWNLIDDMRGFVVGGTDAELNPNLANAESTGTFIAPTGAGFQIETTDAGYNASGVTYIYIAVRRGPMRPPTTGTSVFSTLTRSGSGSGTTISSVTFPPDLFWTRHRTSQGILTTWGIIDKLRGSVALDANATGRQNWVMGPTSTDLRSFDMNGVSLGVNSATNINGQATYANWFFRRAPGFFDVVCYTGNASTNTQSHNLGVAPELVILKNTLQYNWLVFHTFTASTFEFQNLNLTGARSVATYGAFFSSRPTATQLLIAGTDVLINQSFNPYVAYLFASHPGVSKVGSYTGTGATQVVNCGFAAGARFVLIKRTDSTGDWYVWDTARGIVAGNDPYVTLNTTSAEVTNTDWVDTAASGFELSNVSGNLVNTNGASYIFLAIA
jgi:hypothetical protein